MTKHVGYSEVDVLAARRQDETYSIAMRFLLGDKPMTVISPTVEDSERFTRDIRVAIRNLRKAGWGRLHNV